MNSQDSMMVVPFAWAFKPEWISRTEGVIKSLLNHSQANYLSSALKKAYLLAYGANERSVIRHAFDKRMRSNYDGAISALYELLVLSLLRMERWELIDIEPRGEGNRRPDFLMRIPKGNDILIEVKTISEDIFRLEKYFLERLKSNHFVCLSFKIYCTASQATLNKAAKAEIAQALLTEVKANKRRGMSHFDIRMPSGGYIVGRLAGVKPSGPSASRIANLNKTVAKTKLSMATFGLNFERRFDDGLPIGKRFIDSIEDKSSQIDSYGNGTPGIIALCMADPDISIYEAITFANNEIDRRRELDASENLSAVLFVSFFLTQIERLMNEITDTRLSEIAQNIRKHDEKLPVATVSAAWMDVNSFLPKPRIIPSLGTEYLHKLLKHPRENPLKIMYLLEDLI